MSKKLILYGSMAILVLWIGIGSIMQSRNQGDAESRFEHLQLFLAGEGMGRSISCYYSEDESLWYVFLPADVTGTSLTVQSLGCRYMVLEGKQYQTGDLLGELWDGEIKEVSFWNEEGKLLEEGRMKILKSEALPSVYITTASGGMQYIYESKENKEAGNMQIISAEGKLQELARLDYIKGRGNTSWDAPKKSFEIRLDQAADLFGMGSARKWVLVANYYDGAYLRNRIGTELGKAAKMKYTSDSQFVDLYINGEYAGLYQVMEKVELAVNRIELREGYLLEFDYYERAMEKDFIRLANRQPIVVRGQQKVTAQDLAAVQSFIEEMTAALYADDYRNPETGKHVFDYLDKESFAKRYVMEEFLQDMDSGYTSHYMYLDTSDGTMRLYAGPVWDLDNTMGRGNVREPSGLYADRHDLKVNNLCRWYARLYANEEFYQAAVQQYQTFFKPCLTWLTQEGIAQWEAEIAASASMDIALWGTERSVFMPGTALAEHMDYLCAYINGKIEFLDERWNFAADSRQIWLAERLYELPAMKDQIRAIEENDGDIVTAEEEEAGQVTGVWAFIMLYKGYLLFAVMLIFLIVMLGKELMTGRDRRKGM